MFTCKKSQKCVASIFCALSCSVASMAQSHNVEGNISYQDNTPATDVVVTIEELSLSSVTDGSGKYLFSKVPTGDYTLIVTDYYDAASKQSIRVDKDLILQHQLKRNKAEDLGTVVFEHKSDKQKIESSGFAVNVINTEKVALQSVQTNDLLDRTAGVRIRQDGGLGSHIHYNINGQTGNAVRIFIDGVPISNYGPSFSLNTLPPSLIERVEVYKGVIPAHLSEDALGGAINVILKKAVRNNITASYSFGSFNTHQFNFSGRYRNEKNGFTVNASGFYNYSDNSYKVWGKDIYVTDYLGNTREIVARRFHDAFRSYGGIIEAGYTNVKWADKATISAMASSSYKEIQHGTIMRIAYGNRFTTQSSINLGLNYQKSDFLLKGLDIKINGNYAYVDRQVIDTIGDRYTWNGNVVIDRFGNPAQWSSGAEQGIKTASTNLENILVGRANVSYAIHTNHKFYINAFHNTFLRDANDIMRPVAEQLMDDTRNLKKSIIGINYEALAFKQKLRANLFYKYYNQHTISIEPEWTGPVGTSEITTSENVQKDVANGFGYVLSYEIVPNIFLMTSAERAIRLPDAGELFGNAADNIVRSTGLKPEQSLNFNLGINLSKLQYKKHSFAANINTFYRHTNDMIRLNQIDDLSETNSYANFESIVGYGFDAEINYNYAQKLFFLFTLSKFYSTWNVEFDKNGDRYPWYGSQLANEPSFKFNANVNYNFRNMLKRNDNLGITYNAGYVHEFLRNFKAFGGRNVATIPTQFVHDIGLIYTFPSKRIILSLDAKNITNEQVFDNYALQKPGRGFYGKITYNLFK